MTRSRRPGGCERLDGIREPRHPRVPFLRHRHQVHPVAVHVRQRRARRQVQSFIPPKREGFRVHSALILFPHARLLRTLRVVLHAAEPVPEP